VNKKNRLLGDRMETKTEQVAWWHIHRLLFMILLVGGFMAIKLIK
jgi:hypothetical protein